MSYRVLLRGQGGGYSWTLFSTGYLKIEKIVHVPGLGRKRAHVLIMERLLGRELERYEVVHHLNGNTLDNRPENLAVLKTSTHTRLHRA